MENTHVSKEGIAQSLASDLEARLEDLERLGALVAAAHLESAIEALYREFGLTRKVSEPD